MKFSPIAIWVVLFALLACAAEGRGFGSSSSPQTPADVCEAQARIASFSSEMPHATSLVCDFQRALGAMDCRGAIPSDPGAPSLLVTLNADRIVLPSPAPAAWTCWALESTGIGLESIAERANPIPILTGPPAGLRYAYCLAPHAPPRYA